ncbi:DUF262 domain-containing protein [Ideonella sp. A 288]|uniref:GmrSD restriction endonuclease domain-containing protein n=1 Tax=Ideonella sp. A 288 TaxID=1962181 RepID=UPI000B4AF3E6|nr:DUF262 domain-containing protein [Ideonella sp. A 288]
MKATEAKLLAFLKKSPQFVIPIYQRTYSWTERECRQLWDDVVRAGSNPVVTGHFVGSIVYIEQGLFQVATLSPLLVIDGQQRLTTVTLLIAALAEALGTSEPVEGFSARKLRNYYLLNPEEDGERHFKLLLSQTDKATLTSLVGQASLPAEQSVRVAGNYELFRSWLSDSACDLAVICQGLAKLVVVDVALARGQDNPQLIFESMNSTGRKLSQADLIRNYVLMGLEPALQTRLYQDHWRPMELAFGQEGYVAHFDAFMRHYLTLKHPAGEIPRIDEVYEAFKLHSVRPATEQAGVEVLVRDVQRHAQAYCAMALGAESRPSLRDAFHDLRELKVDVAYPFLLELYDDCAQGVLSEADFLAAVRVVEAYVFRRAVCAIPTNSLNKTFATFSKVLKKDRYLESIQAHLLTLPSYRRFPNDEEFQRELQVRDLYHFGGRAAYWLRRLENHNRKERVAVAEYTIEHILPQNDKLPAQWQADLGSDWKRVQETWLHTLGNLTLTAYNSSYSDFPFAHKRDMDEKGLRWSPLKLNDGLGQVTVWDEAAIKARAVKLASKAIDVWAKPALPAEVLAAYRPKAAGQASYTIDDHPHLLVPALRVIFEAFRKEVLALDSCVSEEFLKLYVAYKAETNFVDVVPQAKRLRLSLNMPFSEIDDPKGMCKDVSGLGRWGNGEVEVGLTTMDQLPYVMGLVRQSFDRQMNGAAGS